jgi:acyl-coenzyme A thioesterase PaaI-like protein
VTGSILRDGKKVVVVRMEMKNEEDSLIAVGTGTFLVG